MTPNLEQIHAHIVRIDQMRAKATARLPGLRVLVEQADVAADLDTDAARDIRAAVETALNEQGELVDAIDAELRLVARYQGYEHILEKLDNGPI